MLRGSWPQICGKRGSLLEQPVKSQDRKVFEPSAQIPRTGHLPSFDEVALGLQALARGVFGLGLGAVAVMADLATVAWFGRWCMSSFGGHARPG